MITVLHNSSVSRGSISKYSLTRGQQDPETGLYQYTLALDNIIAADSVVEVIYCHCGSTEDGNAAIGQVVSDTTPASLALQNNVEKENLESLRQRLLPMKAECRTPITIAHEEYSCLYGPVGQFEDPQGEDFNQPFALINLRHGVAADGMGNISSTLAVATTNIEDFICAIQTAEGASGELNSMASRLIECLVWLQGALANGVYNYADANLIVSEIEQLATETATVCEGAMFNDIHLMDRDYDIIVPIFYATHLVDSDLLRLPATWGAADGELRRMWTDLAERLRQAIDNDSNTPSDIQMFVEDVAMPCATELHHILEGQRAHLGSLYNACEYLVCLSDMMDEFYQYQASTYDRAHYWATRREIMESAALEIIRRQRQLLETSFVYLRLGESLASFATESNWHTRLLHLIHDWHQQFGLTDEDIENAGATESISPLRPDTETPIDINP